MTLLSVGWAVTPPCAPSLNLVHLEQQVTVGAEFVRGRRVTLIGCAKASVRCGRQEHDVLVKEGGT
jgi:hypothetical protein